MPGLGLLWGIPFFIGYLGLPAVTAANMVIVTSATAVAAGPVIGIFAGKPRLRLPLAASITIFGILVIVCVVSYGRVAPVVAAAALSVTLGLLGPASMLGLQIARSGVPIPVAAEATGTANTGGYVGMTISVVITGLALQSSNLKLGYSLGMLSTCALVSAALLTAILLNRVHQSPA